MQREKPWILSDPRRQDYPYAVNFCVDSSYGAEFLPAFMDSR